MDKPQTDATGENEEDSTEEEKVWLRTSELKRPNNLFDIRAELGLSKQKMADMLDVPLSTYRSWEEKNHVPHPVTRRKVATKLGKPEEDIWFHLKEEQEEQKSPEPMKEASVHTPSVATEPVKGELIETALTHYQELQTPSPLLTVVHELVDAAGVRERFDIEHEFHLRLDQPTLEPLEIKAWPSDVSYLGEKRHISVVQGAQENEERVASSRVVMTDTGQPIETSQSGQVMWESDDEKLIDMELTIRVKG